MRISLKWLAEYVDITVPPEELARRLTLSSAEVEAIERTGTWDRDKVFVARVVAVAPHPNADRLRLATVEYGGQRQTVVCGAPNVATGQKVAFATAGARIIDGHTGQPTILKPARIRGVESAGMVLSERELGLSDKHEGILVLPEDAPVGVPLADYLGDTVLDIAVAANRPDLMSVVGVAREVAALTAQTVREPDLRYEESGTPAAERVRVEIADPDLCPRYTATLIDGVKVGPSPAWMQERLIAAGMRPINNVVDITNYVMLELGQPVHAFDYTKIEGATIIVRRARAGERLVTLDGVERTLTPDMLVIADAEKPIAVAGVIGGLNSEVGAQTTTVLLESASFNPASVRRTSMALRVRSEASARFEKGPGPVLPEIAARRAAKLMAELAGGRVAPGIVDAYPQPMEQTRIAVTAARLRMVLGAEVPAPEVCRILRSLGFAVDQRSPDTYEVHVPYWRTDIRIPDDVIEEVSRIYGYDRIPARLLAGEIPAMGHEPLREFREEVKNILAAAGMQEVITYSLTTLTALSKVVPPEDLATTPPLRVLNPVSSEHEYLRTSLRSSLLQTLAANLRVEEGPVALFEAGRVYLARENDLPEEVEIVAGVVSGRRLDRWGRATEEPLDFFDAKAYVEYLLERLGLQARYQETTAYAFLPGRTAEIRVEERAIGLLGQVHPRTAAEFDIEDDVYLFEVNLPTLQELAPQRRRYHPIPRYPAVEQDLAIIVDEAIPAARIQEIIRSSPLVREVRPFDVYRGTPVPPGKKSVAFSLSFQAPDRTLTEEEVNRARERIVQRLMRDLGAQLRA